MAVEMSQSMSGLPQNKIDKDPALQWQWHEAYRDMQKNMYRTSYTDATHFRETYVKSDFPAGYGGHIPSIRHDVLHRNTEFDRKAACMRQDPSRDSHISFIDQIAGVPTVTKFPCGAKKNPTKNVSQHDGTTRPLAPWGITVNPSREGLHQRSIPATLQRTRSMPGLQGRPNNAAVGAGFRMATDHSSGSPAHQQGPPSSAGSGRYRGGADAMAMPALSPGGDGLRQSVAFANEEAARGAYPTEAEVLREQMWQQQQQQ